MGFEVQFAFDGAEPGLDKFHIHLRCFAAWEFERTNGAAHAQSSRGPLVDPRDPQMDQESLRILIQRKIRDGRLPHDGITQVWSSRSDGERCDGCDAILSKDQMLMEGVTMDLGRRPLQLHVRCFQIWDHERRAA
jgi:hypothetical protein